jgi:hypothetical protein
MPSTVSLGGVNYSIPVTGDENWGSDVTSYLVAIPNAVLQKAGGSFVLTGEVDFGANYGLKSLYVKSRNANPASSGVLRLGNNESLSWRNQGNTADLALKVNASNELEYSGTAISIAGTLVQTQISVSDTSTINLTLSSNDISGTVIAGSIDNSHIAVAAAIAYSKLNLSGSIVNADISPTAAIQYSKLNVSGSIVDSDLSASAGVSLSKLATLTASRALQTSAGGVIEPSSVTSTELAKLSGISGNITTDSNTQTLTNKTLTAPVINSPTGIVKADVGLSNVDNTSDATKNAAVATLTNKTLTSPVINTPTLDVMTLDGQASAPTNPGAGNYKLYISDTTQKLTLLNSSGVETSVGSGGTGVNFITNGDAEAGTTGWSTYSDAAGTSPVDGTGGAASVTITDSSASPLSGNKSFVLTKDAVNRQGEGFSYDFTVDSANKSRVLSVKFDYLVSSGTFTAGTSSTDSDITVWIYDVTNSTLIQPSSYKLLSNSSTLSDQFQAEFQTSSNSTSYRLIFHISTTNAVSYALNVDNIIVSPAQYVFGTPISDWASYTPTYTGFGAVTDALFWRRVGSNVEIRGKFTSGTSTTTEARVSLPSGLTSAGVSVIPSIQIAGMATYSAAVAQPPVVLIEPSVAYITFGEQAAGTGGLAKRNGDDLVAAAGLVTLSASVPISGWSSSVQMSDSTSTRLVSSYYYKSGGLVGAGAIVPSYSSGSDTHNAFDMTTGIFTVPVAGDYDVSAGISCNLAGIIIGAALNGNTQFQSATSTNGTVGFSGKLRNLKAGDQISIINMTASSITVTSNNFSTYLSITRVSGPAQIASSETVAARYKTTGQAIPNATATIVNFSTSDFDTHGATTTGASWKFTAPVSGIYRVSTEIQYTSAIYNANTLFEAILFKNGSSFSSLGYTSKETNTANIAPTVTGSTLIQLNAGDYVDIRTYQNSTASINLSASNGYNWVAIERVGLRG